MNTSNIPIIDGHNDVLLRLHDKTSADKAADFVDGDGKGHIDLPRLKTGGMVGGFFAIFAPESKDDNHASDDDEDINPPYAGAVTQKSAENATRAMLDLRDEIAARANGGVALCNSAADVRAAMKAGQLALITHIEGAEAIRPDLSNLRNLYDRGLRSIGPVWSRPNLFGAGVPFRFPSSPDAGRGLTPEGEALVRECNALRILVDLSHITERGFWDVVRISNAPIVATHSNAHALCASSRNLTDEQLAVIGRSRGMVGLNFATGFLRADGRWSTDTGADIMIRHLEHMLALAGEDCVGLGSDFDGARIPAFIKDAAGLPALISAMREAGFGAELIEKIAWKNWLRVLEETWGG